MFVMKLHRFFPHVLNIARNKKTFKAVKETANKKYPFASSIVSPEWMNIMSLPGSVCIWNISVVFSVMDFKSLKLLVWVFFVTKE